MSTGSTQALHGGHRDYVGSKLGMWLFLATEVFLFAGPALLYAAYRLAYPEAFRIASSGLDLRLGTVNTAILLTSSLTMALSVTSIRREGGAKLSALLLLITILLGTLFLVNKYFEWYGKISHGIYPGSELLLEEPMGTVVFYGLYFFTTGLHGLHVLGGVFLLAVVAALVISGRVNKDDFIKLENSGLYWHAVDIIWIYLFPIFYLVG